MAELIDTDDRAAAVRAALSFRHAAVAALPSPAATGLRHPRIQVLLARPDETILWDEMAEWFDNLAGLCGERLLRIKGVVCVADRAHPILVQSVGTLFSAPRPFAGAMESFLVLILRDTDPAELMRIEPSLKLNLTGIG
jgi:G3E family GTPase